MVVLYRLQQYDKSAAQVTGQRCRGQSEDLSQRLLSGIGVEVLQTEAEDIHCVQLSSTLSLTVPQRGEDGEKVIET